MEIMANNCWGRMEGRGFRDFRCKNRRFPTRASIEVEERKWAEKTKASRNRRFFFSFRISLATMASRGQRLWVLPLFDINRNVPVESCRWSAMVQYSMRTDSWSKSEKEFSSRRHHWVPLFAGLAVVSFLTNKNGKKKIPTATITHPSFLSTRNHSMR